MDYNYLKTLPKDILIKLIAESQIKKVYCLGWLDTHCEHNEAYQTFCVFSTPEDAVDGLERYLIDARRINEQDSENYSYQRDQADSVLKKLRELNSENRFSIGCEFAGEYYSISEFTIGQI